VAQVTIAIGHLASVASVTRWRGAFTPHAPVRLSIVVSCTGWRGSCPLPFPGGGSLLATPPFPPAGSRRAQFPRSLRYYEGATTSHLRIHGRLCFRSRGPWLPPALCPPQRSRKAGGAFRARALLCRLPSFPAFVHGRQWDLSGLQAILPVPLLRSSTPVEPMCPRHRGHIDAAPALRTAKASAIAISGLTHAASAPAVLRFAFRVATHAQGSLPAGWLAFTGRASNPLDRYERFQLVLTFIPLSCSPDASAISVAHCAASFQTRSPRSPSVETSPAFHTGTAQCAALIAPCGPVMVVWIVQCVKGGIDADC